MLTFYNLPTPTKNVDNYLNNMVEKIDTQDIKSIFNWFPSRTFSSFTLKYVIINGKWKQYQKCHDSRFKIHDIHMRISKLFVYVSMSSMIYEVKRFIYCQAQVQASRSNFKLVCNHPLRSHEVTFTVIRSIQYCFQK